MIVDSGEIKIASVGVCFHVPVALVYILRRRRGRVLYEFLLYHAFVFCICFYVMLVVSPQEDIKILLCF